MITNGRARERPVNKLPANNSIKQQHQPANLPLDNVRWERFARALVNGEKQGKAYVDAGFAPNSGRASRLANDAAVLKRVAFLLQERAEIEQKSTKEAIKAAGLTKQMILDELWENAKQAKAANKWSASNQALHLMGKELGMFREHEKDSNEPDPWKEVIDWISRNNKPHVAVQVNNGQPTPASPWVRE